MVTAVTSIQSAVNNIAGGIAADAAAKSQNGSSDAAKLSAADVQAAMKTADTILTKAQQQADAYNTLLDKLHSALTSLEKSGDMRFQQEYDAARTQLDSFKFDRWDTQLAAAGFSSAPVFGVDDTGHVRTVVNAVSGVFNGVERTVTKATPAPGPAPAKIAPSTGNLGGVPDAAKTAVKAAATILTNAQQQADRYNGLVDKARAVLKLAETGEPRALQDYPAVRSQLDNFKFDRFDLQLKDIGFSSLPPFGSNGAGYVKMIIDTATGVFDGVTVQVSFDSATGRLSVDAASQPKPEPLPEPKKTDAAAKPPVGPSGAAKMSAADIQAALKKADTILTKAQQQADAYNALFDKMHASLKALEKTGDSRSQQAYDAARTQLDAFKFENWGAQLAEAGFSSPPVFGADEAGHVKMVANSVSGVFNGVERTVTKAKQAPSPAPAPAKVALSADNLGGLPDSAKTAVKAAATIIANAQQQADRYNALFDKSHTVLKLAETGDPQALKDYSALRSQLDNFQFGRPDLQLKELGFSTLGAFGGNGAGYVKMIISTATGVFDGVNVQINFNGETGRLSVDAASQPKPKPEPKTASAAPPTAPKAPDTAKAVVKNTETAVVKATTAAVSAAPTPPARATSSDSAPKSAAATGQSILSKAQQQADSYKKLFEKLEAMLERWKQFTSTDQRVKSFHSDQWDRQLRESGISVNTAPFKLKANGGAKTTVERVINVLDGLAQNGGSRPSPLSTAVPTNGQARNIDLEV